MGETEKPIPTQLNIAPRGKSWKNWNLIDGTDGFPTRETMEKFLCNPARVRDLEDCRVLNLETIARLEAHVAHLEKQLAAVQQSVQPEGRTDAEIVERTEVAARFLLKWKYGLTPVADGAQLRHSKNAKAQWAWEAACNVQEIMTDSDAVNAAQEVDDEPATHPTQRGAPTLPEGWVPCVITYEGQHPEEIAYGPQIMMDRLKKWLDRYFEMLAAPAHPAEGVPAPTERSKARIAELESVLAHVQEEFKKFGNSFPGGFDWRLFRFVDDTLAGTHPAQRGLEQDAALLDYLIETGAAINSTILFDRKYLTYPDGAIQKGTHTTARAAIAAALAAQAKQGGV